MPRIGLALGGGAARGLAHIPLLEVLDEMEIRPSIIAGTSMGSLIGAAYASGISGKEIRKHAFSVLSDRTSAARRIFQTGKTSFFDLLNFRGLGAVMVDGDALTQLVLPEGVAEKVEDTKIPFRIVATDFYAAEEKLIKQGSLTAAVAASIAIPGMIAAPEIDGQTLIDGGISNGVPYNHLTDECDITLAIDVTGKPEPKPDGKKPGNSELIIGAMQISQHLNVSRMRETSPPDIYIAPDLKHLRSHEFFKIGEFIEVGERYKKDLQRKIEDAVNAFEKKNP